MNRPGSAVVSTMAKASHDAWKTWRGLGESGRGDSDEAMAAWQQSRDAAEVFLDELASRAKLEGELARARAA